MASSCYSRSAWSHKARSESSARRCSCGWHCMSRMFSWPVRSVASVPCLVQRGVVAVVRLVVFLQQLAQQHPCFIVAVPHGCRFSEDINHFAKAQLAPDQPVPLSVHIQSSSPNSAFERDAAPASWLAPLNSALGLTGAIEWKSRH